MPTTYMEGRVIHHAGPVPTAEELAGDTQPTEQPAAAEPEPAPADDAPKAEPSEPEPAKAPAKPAKPTHGKKDK